jgi:hypothetical protein
MNTDEHRWTGMLVVSHEMLGVGSRANDGWTWVVRREGVGMRNKDEG